MEKFEYRLDEKGRTIGKRCTGYLKKVKGRYQIVVGNEDDSVVIVQLDELLSEFEDRNVILQVEGVPMPRMKIDVFPAVGEDGIKVTIKRDPQEL
jgi:hypothetical protein